MSRPTYDVKWPKHRKTAVVFASPHSGRMYPWSFIRSSQLDETTIRSSEDAFIDQLFASAPEHGAPLLTALLPRAYVELNRGEDELDPALIIGLEKRRYNPRIAAGLGVIPRVVANGQEIRSGKITVAEARARLNQCYHPYHQALRALIAGSQRTFGRAILFDCHSMPHAALSATSFAFERKPEIVLGDRFGASSAPEIMDEAARLFQGAGLRVSRNLPFAGAFVTQTYGRPEKGQHALQIEIDRALYMDEVTIQPNANFGALQQLIGDVVRQLCDLGRQREKLAAE